MRSIRKARQVMIMEGVDELICEIKDLKEETLELRQQNVILQSMICDLKQEVKEIKKKN